jgi:hypothetical protein
MSYFSFFLFSLFLQNWRTGVWNKPGPGGRTDTSGSVEVLGKGFKRIYMVQKVCTHVSKCKKEKRKRTQKIYSRNLLYMKLDLILLLLLKNK